MIDDVLQALTAFPWWEEVAVALAISYLLLALNERILCWYAALASTAIYTILFWDVGLLMESGLNVYYMVMAVYGWYSWRYGVRHHSGVPIHTWAWHRHLIALSAIAAATLISGYLLERHTRAMLPYLDSFTTWASVLTTWMVARKVLENWIYWFVIDALSVYLYLSRGLPLTALLFCFYLVLIPIGFLAWRKDYARARDSLAAA